MKNIFTINISISFFSSSKTIPLRTPSIDQIKYFLNFLFMYKLERIYYVNYVGYVF